jgi:hypothetical protein
MAMNLSQANKIEKMLLQGLSMSEIADNMSQYIPSSDVFAYIRSVSETNSKSPIYKSKRDVIKAATTAMDGSKITE